MLAAVGLSPAVATKGKRTVFNVIVITVIDFLVIVIVVTVIAVLVIVSVVTVIAVIVTGSR